MNRLLTAISCFFIGLIALSPTSQAMVLIEPYGGFHLGRFSQGPTNGWANGFNGGIRLGWSSPNGNYFIAGDGQIGSHSYASDGSAQGDRLSVVHAGASFGAHLGFIPFRAWLGYLPFHRMTGDVLQVGTLVNSQYRGQGVKLGFGTDFSSFFVFGVEFLHAWHTQIRQNGVLTSLPSSLKTTGALLFISAPFLF